MLILFEKHAAVGRLAAGVAHEILNPVSIISSRLQFLEAENLAEPARENVKVCREQLQRIVKISRDLHQSAAKQPGMLVGGDLRRVIEVGLQMTERRIKEDHVQVEYDPPSEVIPVKMERDRLVKVMVNLILNACDAMTGNQPKRLIITVHHPEDSSKDYSIVLTVADNGQGIPAGNLNRIFEPFFTTKDPGKGTGLGLSVSKGIIQEHGGTIHAENNDMGGASFIVELPFDHP
jgi:C4-dicarboxylate-specific signal transduction histidine kinase